MIDLHDVQGLVFAGWGKRYPFAAYVFARLPAAPLDARAWLDGVRAELSWAAAIPEPAHRVQLALTVPGLGALGVPAEVIDRFPQEAKLNMHARSRTLGDEGDNAPASWTLWRDPAAVHALLILYARGEAERAALVKEHGARLAAHGGEVVATELSWHWRTTEPFGFSDGLSQPFVRGGPEREGVARAPDDEIETGEVLLGYTNAYGFTPQSPTWDGFDLGKNGSYLVFRKLEQHVGRFWKYFRDRAHELHGEPPVPAGVERATEWLAARTMGRWRNGTSLVAHPHAPGPETPLAEINAFHYVAQDPRGERCPIGSHVRRANPRDARGGSRDESIKVVNRHRILRRGRAFGEPLPVERAIHGEDGGSRGLLFVALQASIARGFEFVQQTWSANPGFHGLVDEPDPITGVGPGRSFTIPARPVRLRLADLPQFVTMRGGGYLFLPSRSALERIAKG